MNTYTLHTVYVGGKWRAEIHNSAGVLQVYATHARKTTAVRATLAAYHVLEGPHGTVRV